MAENRWKSHRTWRNLKHLCDQIPNSIGNEHSRENDKKNIQVFFLSNVSPKVTLHWLRAVAVRSSDQHWEHPRSLSPPKGKGVLETESTKQNQSKLRENNQILTT